MAEVDRASAVVVEHPWWDPGAGPSVVAVRDGRLVPGAGPRDAAREPVRLAGSLLPGVVDHHVHLGLVERELLADGPVVEVHDLGWDPIEACAFRDTPPAGVRVRVAGPFLTALGGYPAGRTWAPPRAVRQLVGPTEARAAVADAVALGLDAIKVVLHAGMRLLGDDILLELVAAARERGLRVLVHAEGPGQVERAIRVGADTLVHAPWEELVPSDLLAEAASMTWISTLAVHDDRGRAIAVENLRAFREAGGTVRYGTDLGNGEMPVGVRPEEILALGESGLTGQELLAAVTGAPDRPALGDVLLGPAELPRTADDLVDWLERSRRLSNLDLEEAA